MSKRQVTIVNPIKSPSKANKITPHKPATTKLATVQPTTQSSTVVTPSKPMSTRRTTATDTAPQSKPPVSILAKAAAKMQSLSSSTARLDSVRNSTDPSNPSNSQDARASTGQLAKRSSAQRWSEFKDRKEKGELTPQQHLRGLLDAILDVDGVTSKALWVKFKQEPLRSNLAFQEYVKGDLFARNLSAKMSLRRKTLADPNYEKAPPKKESKVPITTTETEDEAPDDEQQASPENDEEVPTGLFAQRASLEREQEEDHMVQLRKSN